MLKRLLLFAIILIFCGVVFFIGRNAESLDAKVHSESKKEVLNSNLLKILNDEKIKSLQTWDDENDKKFVGVIRHLDKPFDKDSILPFSEQLNIYDEKGKSVYEFKDISIDSFEFARLKSDSTQMIIESNGGGTDNFLTLVNLKDGKFIELNVEGDTQLRGGWWTMPEYRSDLKSAYFNTSQLIVIQQIGGADNDPRASVFRNRNNKFQKVGEISMNELGDSIEKQLNQNKKDGQK